MSTKRISQLSELTQAAAADYLIIVDESTGQTKRITVANLVGIPDIGWTATAENWAYSSWNSATNVAVITVPSNATTKYSVGMLVRFSQSTGGTKYGRILSVASTSLTVWMPGYTFNNETVSTPVYSALAQPYGAPADLSTANPYRFSAYKSASSTISDTTATDVVFNTEYYDKNANYNSTTGVFTAPVTGLYQFSFLVTLMGNGTGTNMMWDSYAELVKNGSSYVNVRMNQYDNGYQNIIGLHWTGELELTAGDTIKVRAYGDTANGTAPNVSGGGNLNGFTGRLLSRL